MTNQQLFDWVIQNGCVVEPLDEYKARVIYFRNPNNGNKAWMNLPIDGRPIKDPVIIMICSRLSIPVPTIHT